MNLPARSMPTDGKTGLTLPLSKFLGSQDLAKHQAMIALELEVMAKKMDRFGWERDRGTLAHDRLVKDWIAALQDYPLSEVQVACSEWVKASPRKMPNEGDILGLVINARKAAVRVSRATQPEPEKKRVSQARAAEIMAEAGFKPKRFGGAS